VVKKLEINKLYLLIRVAELQAPTYYEVLLVMIRGEEDTTMYFEISFLIQNHKFDIDWRNPPSIT